MTPEAERFLAKATECLQDAERFEAFAPRIAAREAYLTAYHAAEALIHDRSGQVAKTHRGVRIAFVQLTRHDPKVPQDFHTFLAQAYELKAIADYGTGAEAIITRETAQSAISKAQKFLALVTNLLGAP